MRRGLGWLIDEDAQRGLAGDRRADPEAGRPHDEAASAPDANPGSDHWIGARDCVAGRQFFPRIELSVDPPAGNVTICN